ncbi:MAG: glycosyl hydrolase family 18 protein [Thermaerobacter sp.]|nr:glycosyl hydrolase family 18 protein [Thermaerobacter sp.]
MSALSPQRSLAAFALVALIALLGAAGARLPTHHPSLKKAAARAGTTPRVVPPDGMHGVAAPAPSKVDKHQGAADAPAAPAPPVGGPASSSASSSTPAPHGSPSPTPPPAHSGPFVLGYYVEWAGRGSASDFAAHSSQLSGIAPLWFSLHKDASLHLRGPGDIATVSATAHALGKKVLALVTNDGQGAILVHPSLRALAVQHLVDAVLADQLDGVNIDFESIDGTDAQGLDAFVADVSAQLRPRGLLTTVAVGPRASSNIPVGDQSAAYDYASLGRSADYLVLMTYDEHGPGTAPGPVAGIGFVRAVVDYALQEMPAQKILLGIAAYGYDWGQPGTPTVTAKSALLDPPGPLTWDQAAEETHIVSPDHDIWLEDPRSEYVRFLLAKQDDLGGLALWYLGAEDNGLWQQLSTVYGSP